MKLFHEEQKLNTVKKIVTKQTNEVNTGEFKAILVSNPQVETNNVKYLKSTEINQNLNIDQLDYIFGKIIINSQMNDYDLQSLYFLNIDIICNSSALIIYDLLRDLLYKQWAIGANF
jgi:hypothetical protein